MEPAPGPVVDGGDDCGEAFSPRTNPALVQLSRSEERGELLKGGAAPIISWWGRGYSSPGSGPLLAHYPSFSGFFAWLHPAPALKRVANGPQPHAEKVKGESCQEDCHTGHHDHPPGGGDIRPSTG